jgi:hypothetical protein
MQTALNKLLLRNYKAVRGRRYWLKCKRATDLEEDISDFWQMKSMPSSLARDRRARYGSGLRLFALPSCVPSCKKSRNVGELDSPFQKSAETDRARLAMGCPVLEFTSMQDLLPVASNFHNANYVQECSASSGLPLDVAWPTGTIPLEIAHRITRIKNNNNTHKLIGYGVIIFKQVEMAHFDAMLVIHPFRPTGQNNRRQS